jgi:hypothetical protein
MAAGLLLVIYAGLSFALFDALSRRITDAHPQVEKKDSPRSTKCAGGTRPTGDISN